MVHIPLNRHLISWCILICFTCGFYTTTLFASPDYWPTNAWRSSTPEEQGMDSGKLIEMMEMVRDEDYAIDNITIIRNGYLVTDAYLFPSFDVNRVKSINGTLIHLYYPCLNFIYSLKILLFLRTLYYFIRLRRISRIA